MAKGSLKKTVKDNEKALRIALILIVAISVRPLSLLLSGVLSGKIFSPSLVDIP
jgi:hypothetical protein